MESNRSDDKNERPGDQHAEVRLRVSYSTCPCDVPCLPTPLFRVENGPEWAAGRAHACTDLEAALGCQVGRGRERAVQRRGECGRGANFCP